MNRAFLLCRAGGRLRAQQEATARAAHRTEGESMCKKKRKRKEYARQASCAVSIRPFVFFLWGTEGTGKTNGADIVALPATSVRAGTARSLAAVAGPMRGEKRGKRKKGSPLGRRATALVGRTLFFLPPPTPTMATVGVDAALQSPSADQSSRAACTSAKKVSRCQTRPPHAF